MANTSSAKRAIRVAKRKRKINVVKIEAYKKAKKTVLDLLQAGKAKEAEKELPKAYKLIDKAAKDNTIHKKTAARYKSRLSSRVNTAVSAK